MPNTYFQFKQFTIHQQYAAMKVCTDSCLFGAWVAHLTEIKVIGNCMRILDIGTGTGLLSLLLAQKINAFIDGVETDEESFKEAVINFSESPWKQHLQAFRANVKQWKAVHKYDLIISNPPFYENDLLPASKGKALSKHSNELTLKQLLNVSNTLINDKGTLAILLPFKRSREMVQLSKDGSWNIALQTDVKQTTAHTHFRSIFILQKEKKEMVKNELSIKDTGNAYTINFKELLKDYYLHL